MGIKRIIVNRAIVDENAVTDGPALPIFTVLDGEQRIHGNSIAILGPRVMLYNPKGSPAAGRRVWIETTAEVVVQGSPTISDQLQQRLDAVSAEPCAPCDDNSD